MASILNVKLGVNRVRWCLGRDGTGKQITGSVTVHGNRRDAERVKREKERELELGLVQRATDMKVGEFLAEWCDEMSLLKAPRTADGYRFDSQTYLIPTLGSIKLQRFTEDHIRHLKLSLLEREGVRGKSLSKRTIQRILSTLRKALNDAHDRGLIWRSLNWRGMLPTPDRRPIEPRSKKELAEIIRAVRGSDIDPYIQFMANTGVRRGEASAIPWSCIDFEKGTATIAVSLQRLTGKGLVIASTKSRSSDRTIQLDSGTVAMLRRHLRQQDEHRAFFGSDYHESGLVFPWDNGRPRDPNTVLKRLQTILKRAGIARIRLHDFRHAHASHLIADGVSPKVVQERLGHSSVQFTLQVYGHLLPGQHQAAADNFAASLSDEIDRAVDARLTQPASERLEQTA